MATMKDVQIALEEALLELLGVDRMRKIGEVAADRIKLRTRLGGSVADDGGTKSKLKPLKNSTVKSRARKRKSGDLHGDTSPKKSNLTDTGQLLDSIKVIEPVTKGAVKIGPKGSRREGGTNELVAVYAESMGRPFNHLSKVEIKVLQRELQKELQTIAQRRLTKLRK